METTKEKPIERLTETEVLERLERARRLAKSNLTSEALQELIRAIQGWVCGVKK